MLLLCLRLLHGTYKTNVWQEMLTPSTWAFSCEVVHENYEYPSIFVNVTAIKSVAPLLSSHGVCVVCRH